MEFQELTEVQVHQLVQVRRRFLQMVKFRELLVFFLQMHFSAAKFLLNLHENQVFTWKSWNADWATISFQTLRSGRSHSTFLTLRTCKLQTGLDT
jgi:hypothetical protein